MSEKKLIIDQLKFAYDGPFDLPGLYRLIDSFFYEKGFDKHEKLNVEQVLPTGRSIKIEVIPYKNLSDYFRIHIRIRIYGSDIKRIEIEKDGAKIPLSDGKLMVIIDGYIESDRHSVWEDRPTFWFIRTIFDKYIFKGHYMKAEQWLVSDVEDIYQRMRSFLNVYKYRERGILAPHVIG